VNRLSLSNRLFITVSFVLIAFLSISAFSLNTAFQASADSTQQKRLKNYVYSLLTAAQFTESGEVKMPDTLAKPEFSLPNSGLYALVSDEKGTVWRSKSLLGLVIDPLLISQNTETEHYSTIELSSDTQVLNLAYRVIWENSIGQQYIFIFNVAEDLATLKQQKMGFERNLWYWLGGTGIALLLVQLIILRWSLRPLNSVANGVRAIESGLQQRLSNDYPTELKQLTKNINALLDHEEFRRKRYQNSLADLAHSLKTPLAVLRSDIQSTADLQTLQQNSSKQLKQISDLVHYQLQHASTEGKTSLQAPHNIKDIINKLTASLQKVYLAKQIKSHIDIKDDIIIHADEGDLYELLGNLLDNAFKYCRNQVKVTVEHHEDVTKIKIEDDGPGIPSELHKDVLKRGRRLDTQMEGQGIGLAIVGDIVDAYQGEIQLSHSQTLGGAEIVISLNQ